MCCTKVASAAAASIFVRHLGGVPDKRVFDRIIAMVTPLGWHIDLHFDAIDLPEYADMLTRLPLGYTIDHMGRVKAAQGLDQLPFRILIELMQCDEKCWVKICGSERVSSSGPPFTDAVPFARKIVETAPDRVIWGTDWPHPNVKVMPNDGDLVDLIPLFAPEPEFQQKILVDNPARLFEFDR
ncbi:putative TIM-barrel fold metal-dependent hydrolase [Bradyrhizobium japonicum]